MQGARVRSLVRELDPICMPQLRSLHAATKTSHMPQLKILHASTKTWHGQKKSTENSHLSPAFTCIASPTINAPLFFFKIYLFLAALGLCCCAQAFSSCGEQGLLFVAVCRLLIAVVFLCCRAQALGTRAQ